MTRNAEQPRTRFPPKTAFSRLIAEALARRTEVALTTDAYRMIDDRADALPDLVVDRYGDFAVISAFSDESAAAAPALAESLVSAGLRGVYLKRRVRADLRRAPKDELAPEAPLCGDPAPSDLVVTENGMKLRVDLGTGLSTGLFTDQRDSRALVRASANGARVLNLFSYTCSFTVAAALGGASATTSVDLSQRALTRGHDNLVLNGVDGAAHRLLRGDAPSFVKRARRRGDRFDLVILDPPSFGTHRRGTFSVERDYRAVAEDALAVLAPGGRLLAVTNHLGTSRSALRALVEAAAAGAHAHFVEIRDLSLPADHAYRPNGEEPTKTVLATVR